MSDGTKIQWTRYSFNPWWGCARVSPACRFCYAEDIAHHYGHNVWRRHGDRKMMADSTWARPEAWNRKAQAAGIPAKVFCASMADVFEDHPQVVEPRKRLWDLIERTPWLQWQLLTKRPENIGAMAPWGSDWPEHVWVGTSVETQRWADARIPALRAVPAKTRFLSAEPLLASVRLDHHLASGDIHQVIIGGESGSAARPMDIDWAQSLIDQCRAAGVAAFMKQVGTVHAKGAGYSDRKHGGDISEWPAALQVRQYPRHLEAVAV